MVHIVDFTNKFLVEIIFSTDKVFYKTIHPRRVSFITSYGIIGNKINLIIYIKNYKEYSTLINFGMFFIYLLSKQHRSQRGKWPHLEKQSHLKSQSPPEMTLLKSKQNFQTCLNSSFLFTPISNIYFKSFQDDWSQNNNRQTFIDRHLLIPIN